MITTFFPISSWARAASSFSPSLTASCTNAFTTGSPNAWSIPFSNPPPKPFTPAMPRRRSNTAWSPSSTSTFTSPRIRTISRTWFPSKSWFPSTAAQGTRSIASASASVSASVTVPWSVRSPARTSPSASPFTARTSSRNRPCWSARPWRSATAASRKVPSAMPHRPLHALALGLVPRAPVLVPEVLEVVPVLHARDEVPAAQLERVIRPELLLDAREERHEHAVRDLGALAGVREPEEEDVREEDLPVPLEANEEPVPVELVAARAEQVVHVGAVVALALEDEGLRPDHLLHRREQDLDAHDLRPARVAEPEVVHHGDAVSGGEDEVDVPLAPVRLADPARVRHLGPEPGALEDSERLLDIALAQEDVEVLRVPEDAGVLEQRVRPRHEERHARPGERPQGVGARVELTRVPHHHTGGRIGRRGHGDKLGLLPRARKPGTAPTPRPRLPPRSAGRTVAAGGTGPAESSAPPRGRAAPRGRLRGSRCRAAARRARTRGRGARRGGRGPAPPARPPRRSARPRRRPAHAGARDPRDGRPGGRSAGRRAASRRTGRRPRAPRRATHDRDGRRPRDGDLDRGRASTCRRAAGAAGDPRGPAGLRRLAGLSGAAAVRRRGRRGGRRPRRSGPRADRR